MASTKRTAWTRSEESLRRAHALEPRDLEQVALARGPLDAHDWIEVLLPWLGARLRGDSPAGEASRVEAAINLERRFGRELGLRLAASGVLAHPTEVAYLTVEERLQAVHGGDSSWSSCARRRSRRLEEFVSLDVPQSFWGPLRVGPDKSR